MTETDPVRPLCARQGGTCHKSAAMRLEGPVLVDVGRDIAPHSGVGSIPCSSLPNPTQPNLNRTPTNTTQPQPSPNQHKTNTNLYPDGNFPVAKVFCRWCHCCDATAERGLWHVRRRVSQSPVDDFDEKHTTQPIRHPPACTPLDHNTHPCQEKHRPKDALEAMQSYSLEQHTRHTHLHR